MRLKSDDPDPYYGLGQTLKSLGDTAGAIEAFRKYVGMEKRPDEQRWVDKARAELEALEAMQRSSSPRASGKIEEKDSGDDVARRASEKLRRELERDQLAPLTDDDIVDPFQRDTWGPRQLRDLKDPFGHDTPIPPGISLDRRRLLEYEAAVQEFRRALSRHAEDVTARYQRGARLAMLADARGATRAWDSVMLVDARVDAARKSVERVRQLLDVRK
jgi:tetratricopeptide (TPR) repeat protein